MRITNAMLINTVLGNLQNNMNRMLKIQDQLSSGKVVDRPSDDPGATGRILRFKSEIEINDQYLTNIDEGKSWLTSSDDSFAAINTLMQRTRELAVYGASETLGNQEREKIADEVNQLLLETIEIGNSNFKGSHIFAGFKTLTPPFSTIIDQNTNQVAQVNYNGDDGQRLVEIGIRATTAVNISGQQGFMNILKHRINGGAAVASTQEPLANAGLYPPPTDGTFSLSVNGQSALVSVNTATDNLESLKNKINATGLAASAYITQDDQGQSHLVLEALNYGEAGSIQIHTGTSNIMEGLQMLQDLNPGAVAVPIIEATPLESLNNGQGVAAGTILITDKRGITEQIDLSGASTVADVLAAINSAGGIRFQATINPTNTGIDITDFTGGSGELAVAEDDDENIQTNTAADLGLLFSTAGTVIRGGDLNPVMTSDTTLESLELISGKIPRLSIHSPLSSLGQNTGIADKTDPFTISDGLTLITVDLSTALTISDIQEAIDLAIEAEPAFATTITLQVADDDHLVLRADDNLTPLSIAEVGLGQTAADLGILGLPTDGTSELVGTDLDPGLGKIEIRNGYDENDDQIRGVIDLSGAATVSDILNRINTSGLYVSATINPAGNGFELSSTRDGSTPIVLEATPPDVDGLGTTAASLGILTVEQPTIRAAKDIFGVMIDFRDALRNNNTAEIEKAITEIDLALEKVMMERSKLGSRVNRMDLSQNRLESIDINLKELLSIEEDIDMTELIMDLKMSEYVYRASLSAGSKVMMPTLLDFL